MKRSRSFRRRAWAGAFTVASLWGGPAAADFQQVQELCAAMHSMSSSIMEARQAGAPAGELHSLADGQPQDIRPVIHAIVDEALSVPRRASRDGQLDVVDSFAWAQYQACLRSFSE